MPTIGTIVKIVTFVKIVNNFQYTRHCRFSLLFIAIHIFLSLGFPYWTDFKQSVFFGLRQYVTNTWFYLVNWCTDNCSLILSALAVRAFHNIWDNNDNHIWDFIWNAFVHCALHLLKQLCVALFDTALFQKMNILFEWIFWILKKWIFCLNEYSGF